MSLYSIIIIGLLGWRLEFTETVRAGRKSQLFFTLSIATALLLWYTETHHGPYIIDYLERVVGVLLMLAMVVLGIHWWCLKQRYVRNVEGRHP